MSEQEEDNELNTLLNGLKSDVAGYFKRAEEALAGLRINTGWQSPQDWVERDRYWAHLPEGIRSEAKRLDDRLISLMKQIARAVRNAPLASEADQRDVTTGTKAMRAALLLRRFRSWDAEILNDEDVVLGVTPAGQSDDTPCEPKEAGRTFVDWMEKISAILDLVAASPDLASVAGRQVTDAVRPGTGFIMMWLDKSQDELIDVSDTVKEVFEKFDINAVRADDIEHEGLITSRVLTEIKTAEFCFADVTGSRPNVYYEVGYAHALSRRVILFRRAGTGLHFDLAGYNCPGYKNLRDLKEKLTVRLRALTNKEPKS